jgi:hypothetical protein
MRVDLGFLFILLIIFGCSEKKAKKTSFHRDVTIGPIQSSSTWKELTEGMEFLERWTLLKNQKSVIQKSIF